MRSWAAGEWSPEVFALVMATGIVSIAAADQQYHVIALILGALAAVAFALLTIIVSARVARAPAAFGRQLRDPDVALRSFTFVAACGVLAAELGPQLGPQLGQGQTLLAWSLGAVALLAWLGLVPAAIIDMRSRSAGELRDHAHGSWLLISVGTQSLAISAADLAHGTAARPLLLLALAWWTLGLVGYFVVTWLIMWRALVGPLAPEEVTPDSWILMGALAISTLAGDRILAARPATTGLDWLITVARPQTLVLWIMASGWIPLLLSAQMWRVARRPASLQDEGVWWAVVFPLGMYSSATFGLGGQLHIPALRTVSLSFFWLGLTTWLIVALGLLHNQWRLNKSVAGLSGIKPC
ncbi:MAG: tellurite resistance/C4-dicarboxylate transporter family protein [Pseudonocardiaceae bacterium]